MMSSQISSNPSFQGKITAKNINIENHNEFYDKEVRNRITNANTAMNHSNYQSQVI